MGLAQLQPSYTVEEYLALERAAEERSEYLDGVIYAMAGESEEHGDISVNIAGELRTQLKGQDCRARLKDTKVRSGPIPNLRNATKGLYSYPDVVVICGERQFHDSHRDVILNLTVIIEILSPATEAFDRGEKFDRYQFWNPTLSDYLLVSQDQPKIEHFIRQSNGSWNYAVYRGLASQVEIKSIQCTLKLSEVYDRIVFPPESADRISLTEASAPKRPITKRRTKR
ncbi:MAG: Uma2 family endonuclease [Blastocatellia bacterium]|nr:Uma2 family endonuclease [Blastocatellia bacterium]